LHIAKIMTKSDQFSVNIWIYTHVDCSSTRYYKVQVSKITNISKQPLKRALERSFTHKTLKITTESCSQSFPSRRKFRADRTAKNRASIRPLELKICSFEVSAVLGFENCRKLRTSALNKGRKPFFSSNFDRLAPKRRKCPERTSLVRIFGTNKIWVLIDSWGIGPFK